MLDLLMLLSALESWGFSTKERIPDFLLEKLNASIDVLTRELLDPK
jgi:hypothetical protein